MPPQPLFQKYHHGAFLEALCFSPFPSLCFDTILTELFLKLLHRFLYLSPNFHAILNTLVHSLPQAGFSRKGSIMEDSTPTTQSTIGNLDLWPCIASVGELTPDMLPTHRSTLLQDPKGMRVDHSARPWDH